ncbi:MAG TPA: hypothetical protein VK149_02160 [Sideroxyarcus sp.]|nr:hypothetical protein [Sideroxyarcus sp.]
MKTQYLIGMAALLMTMSACSQTTKPSVSAASGAAAIPPSVVVQGGSSASQTMPGSYIVRASGEGAAAIRRVFVQYGVTAVNELGNEYFEMRLQRDPGLEVLTRLMDDSKGAIGAIQPNHVYHAN